MNVANKVLKRTKGYWLSAISKEERTELVDGIRSVTFVSGKENVLLNSYALRGASPFTWNAGSWQIMFRLVDIYLESSPAKEIGES